ncbi:uncharacterized protein LOC142537616 [Primulina tabacum]|uniref:uncharacterized protein LOC142537616 n=1 Tax=Primulina tabacum TaxID=48773 RepID=UPI003F591898
MRSSLGCSSSGGKVKQSYVASTLWSLPQSRTRLLHIQVLMFPATFMVMSRSLQHTPSAHASQDVSGTRSGDLNRSSSSTSSPMRTGPRVHFGLNPSRQLSPLEHRFERRLTVLEDSVRSMYVKMSAEFIETRACIRNINMALDDMKSSFNLGLDELRSSMPEQIRAGFAEMRSNMLVHQNKNYSVAYSRGRKRKSSEADFGVDDNLAREIGSSSQTQHIFEPNLAVITEESSEDIQVTPDACKPGGEATTSRGVDDNLATQQIFEPNLPSITEESSEGEQIITFHFIFIFHSEDCGAFVLAVAGYSLSTKSAQLVLTFDEKLVSEFRYFLACNMFLNDWSLL